MGTRLTLPEVAFLGSASDPRGLILTWPLSPFPPAPVPHPVEWGPLLLQPLGSYGECRCCVKGGAVVSRPCLPSVPTAQHRCEDRTCWFGLSSHPFGFAESRVRDGWPAGVVWVVVSGEGAERVGV